MKPMRGLFFALCLLPLGPSAMAQERKPITVPEFVYVLSHEGVDLVQRSLPSSSGSSQNSAYYNILSALKGQTTMVREEVDEKTRFISYHALSGRPHEPALSRLIDDGPLFYLTDEQVNWYGEQDGVNRLAVPDLALENHATLWMGRCEQNSASLEQILAGFGYNPRVFFNAMLRAAYKSSSFTSAPGARSNPIPGLLTLTTKMHRYYAPTAEDFPEDITARMNPRKRPEVFLSSTPLFGDTILIGQIRGPQPLEKLAFRVLGAVERGEAFEVQSVLLPSGIFIVYLPCRSISDIERKPIVVEMKFRRHSQALYFPLRLVSPESWPRSFSATKFAESYRFGIAPETWQAHREIGRSSLDSVGFLTSVLDILDERMKGESRFATRAKVLTPAIVGSSGSAQRSDAGWSMFWSTSSDLMIN